MANCKAVLKGRGFHPHFLMKLVPLVLTSLAPVATATPAVAQNPLPAPPVLNAPTPQILAQSNQLPASIANAVLQQHSLTTGRPAYAFRLANASLATWSDSCLGLAVTNEFCAPVQVSGWRVALSDDLQQWIYRTDASGLVIRLETTAALAPGTATPPGYTSPGYSPQTYPPQTYTPPGYTPPGYSAPSPVAPTPAIVNDGWDAELRWSRLVDSPDPEVLFQLMVLQKPETLYANVVYQFYAREKGKSGWTYIYTTLGARLLQNGSGSVELPLESLKLDEVAQKMGYQFNWSNTDIRVSVLLRYDLSKEQRDLRLKFQHDSSYTAITPLSLTQLQRTAGTGASPTPGVNPYAPPPTNPYLYPTQPVTNPSFPYPAYPYPSQPATVPVQQGFTVPGAAPAYPTVPTSAPPPGVPVLPPLSTPYPYMN